MNPPAISFADEAKEHLLLIIDRIKLDAPDSAVKWVDKLVDTITCKAVHPTSCRLAPEDETHDFEIRQILFGKERSQYRILFTQSPTGIHILDVRHAMRKHYKPGSLKI